MTARAKTSSECDVLCNLARNSLAFPNLLEQVTYRARVDGNAVILVINFGSTNDNVRARANVKSVGVVSATAVTSTVVNCHSSDGKSIDTIHADGLDRCVPDVQVGDG